MVESITACSNQANHKGSISYRAYNFYCRQNAALCVLRSKRTARVLSHQASTVIHIQCRVVRIGPMHARENVDRPARRWAALKQNYAIYAIHARLRSARRLRSDALCVCVHPTVRAFIVCEIANGITQKPRAVRCV